MHEHRPSHLAPAGEREKIMELNRKIEAKRAAESAAKAAAEEAAEATAKAAKLKASAEAAAKVPEILTASSLEIQDAERLVTNAELQVSKMTDATKISLSHLDPDTQVGSVPSFHKSLWVEQSYYDQTYERAHKACVQFFCKLYELTSI